MPHRPFGCHAVLSSSIAVDYYEGNDTFVCLPFYEDPWAGAGGLQEADQRVSDGKPPQQTNKNENCGKLQFKISSCQKILRGKLL